MIESRLNYPDMDPDTLWAMILPKRGIGAKLGAALNIDDTMHTFIRQVSTDYHGQIQSMAKQLMTKKSTSSDSTKMTQIDQIIIAGLDMLLFASFLSIKDPRFSKDIDEIVRRRLAAI